MDFRAADSRMAAPVVLAVCMAHMACAARMEGSRTAAFCAAHMAFHPVQAVCGMCLHHHAAHRIRRAVRRFRLGRLPA